MFRNVAGQNIGIQILNLDGTAFTGTPSVFVTKDNGTQTAGAGTVTNNGNGTFNYAPTQAETDATLIKFTATGTGAAPAMVQVEPIDKDAADALNASANTIGFGTVGSGSTTTSVVVSAISIPGGVSVDGLAGRRVYFRRDTTTAALRGAGARIIANTGGTTPTLTLEPLDELPGTPASGDVFAIL